MKQRHVVFDTEIIGSSKPVFLVCCEIVETGERMSFWHHRKGDVEKFNAMLSMPGLTWVGFNSAKFDNPLLAAWINGRTVDMIKIIATKIIEERMQPWDAYRLAGMDGLKIDHIDLIEVAPGVMTSLKTYAGRMNYPSMVDLPFHHDDDLTPAQCRVLESYCMNDLGVTEALFMRLLTEIQLRVDLGATYKLDLRSKSDAQAAEAILKRVVGLSKGDTVQPECVVYDLPAIIKTNSAPLNDLIKDLVETNFFLDKNGSPEMPDWLDKKTFELRGGTYKVGMGGLHSQHDTRCYFEAKDGYEISDIDAKAYYPSLMLLCNFIPHLNGKGQLFIDTYRDLYEQRMDAKRDGNKKIDSVLKIALNGTFGKLGNIFCSFYSPDLLLAVTLTGQLNLLNLIDAIGKHKGMTVLSANTDGIMVRYPTVLREKLFKVVAQNAKQTGLEYDETRYSKVAMKDVNNYIAIKTNGDVKAKGLYAATGLQKNPTAPVCALAAAEYLKKGTKPETFIKRQKKIEPFLSIRAVKGGGVQHTKYVEVDDWMETEPDSRRWYREAWAGQEGRALVKRKSRPDPVSVGTGGKPFGRVARWYMSSKEQPAITYVSNGNRVPKTEGAQLCMTLPSMLPLDIDYAWYVNETYEMLEAMGVDTHRKI